jgi:hypothetical protein
MYKHNMQVKLEYCCKDKVNVDDGEIEISPFAMKLGC